MTEINNRPSVEEVLDFWFGPPPLRPNNALWWGGQSQDAAIRERFGEVVEKAVSGSLDQWGQQPRSALAMVILLDQMTRNVFRGRAEAFAGDARALGVTLSGLERGFLGDYHPYEAAFFLMPLEHDETIESQDRCVQELEALRARCGGDTVDIIRGHLDYAQQHREIIRKFGRYPHRNQVLGRESSADEIDYLATGGRRFGQ